MRQLLVEGSHYKWCVSGWPVPHRSGAHRMDAGLESLPSLNILPEHYLMFGRRKFCILAELSSPLPLLRTCGFQGLHYMGSPLALHILAQRLLQVSW